MPDFTFQGPDGKQVTITGPAGSTREQAIQILNQHLGSQPAGPQAEQPAGQASAMTVDKDGYYSKLSDMLDGLRQQLAPSWNHNNAAYSPYKPAQPGNMPNDAINPVGTDAQMAAATGGVGAAARIAGNIPKPPQPGPQPPVNMNQMPTQQAIQNNAGLGGRVPPSSPVGGNPGVTAQQGFLRQAAGEALKKGGDLLPFPLNHAAKFAPRMLGLEK